MAMVWRCYGYGMAMLWLWYGYGMAMLWLWYGDAIYGYGMAMLWLWYGYGMAMLWLWYGDAMAMLWLWYGSPGVGETATPASGKTVWPAAVAAPPVEPVRYTTSVALGTTPCRSSSPCLPTGGAPNESG